MPVVNHNGASIGYEERGSGEPLVLLMGLGADGSLWEEHVRAYEKYFRCIMVDNRGAGQSFKPNGPYATEQMAQDTLGLMRQLGIERAHVAGISMGSAIAQHVALLAPESVISLSLHCPWSSCDTYTRRIFEAFATAYGQLAPGEFQQLLQLFIYTPSYHEQYIDKLLNGQREAEQHPNRMPAEAFRAQCAACIGHDTTGRLGSIRTPTLITVGEIDMFTPLRLSQSIAAEIPGAELAVFAGSGHTHHWDQLERFNDTTPSFMLRHRLHS